MPKTKSNPVLKHIENKILVIRGQQVMLDSDLARLYGVTTKRLNEQVRRNIKRFPERYGFQLKEQDVAALRSQNATIKGGKGQHRKYLPWVFSEYGAVMLATVLKSNKAVEANKFVIEAFISMRKAISKHDEIMGKMQDLDGRISKNTREINNIWISIGSGAKPNVKKKIGFKG